ncbi:MAG TPA: cytochrome c oxidase assembly protein [Gemmatimonadaceae bacterium]|jgi:putative membrane protein|nr:cytochrome c oxidase assembly protein [Gemmatimonadaceae bacterium]
MSLALLHTGARIGWTQFTVHPSTVLGIAALGGLYEYGRREASPSPLPSARPVPFYLALAVLFFSLNGPLHDLSDSNLFSAHMLQHLMLAFVVAPLMIMGVSGEMLRPALRLRAIRSAAEWLTRPVHAFAIFTVVVAAWHLPPLYNYALAHHPAHIVMHLMFLAAAVIMWWPILSPLPELPRLSYPGQMLYLFLMSIPMAIVAVYICYADTILYPMYASAPRVWGISPMDDQMFGGLLMWIPGGLYFYTIISVVFYRWQVTGAHDSRDAAQVGAVARL